MERGRCNHTYPAIIAIGAAIAAAWLGENGHINMATITAGLIVVPCALMAVKNRR